ncbi:MAG: hypothetical protein GY863_19950, partial [bacterium]|nr:hypothetical protein [bacterium]MCP4727320.1 hypothetical protein [bacterium]
RAEELSLLAIWRLKENAYLVTVREYLIETTAKDWSVGAVFDSLDRLRKKGYVETYLGNPTSIRGGRSKRFYEVSKRGRDALNDIKRVNDEMWNGYTEAIK